MKKGRILLAEENEGAALAISDMLKNKIEQLDWARNVQELMQKYQSTQYQCCKKFCNRIIGKKSKNFN